MNSSTFILASTRLLAATLLAAGTASHAAEQTAASHAWSSQTVVPDLSVAGLRTAAFRALRVCGH